MRLALVSVIALFTLIFALIGGLWQKTNQESSAAKSGTPVYTVKDVAEVWARELFDPLNLTVRCRNEVDMDLNRRTCRIEVIEAKGYYSIMAMCNETGCYAVSVNETLSKDPQQ